MACSIRPGKFFKLSSLILDVGTKSLVFKLRVELQKAGLSFQGFLSFHKHELFHLYEKRGCCQCQIDRSRSYWTRTQWLKLFSESSTQCNNKGECMCRYVVVCQTEGELDISLLSSILLHACSLSQAERQDVINLRNQRNEFFAHARTAELEEAVYQKGLNEATDSIKSIAHSCRDKKLYDEIENDIENLIQSPLDDKLCRHVISILPFVTENAEKLVEKVLLKVQEAEDKKTSEIEKLRKCQEKNREEIKRIKSVLNLPEQNENEDSPPNTHGNLDDMQREEGEIKKGSEDSVVEVYSSSAEDLQNVSAAEGKVVSIKRDYLGFPKTRKSLSNTKVQDPDAAIDGTFDEDQLMAIHMACNNGDVDILKYHLEEIPPGSTLLTATNSQGYNVLHIAARSGSKEIFKLLVSYGVNTELTTSKNQSILHLACVAGKSDMCRYILGNCPDMVDAEDETGVNAAHYAVRGGNVTVLEMLHENGINMYCTDKLKQNILHVACIYGMFEMCQFIISQYPDMLHSIDNDGCNTALHAARGGNVHILKLLKDNSVNLTHTNNHKCNILHVACQSGMFGMCHFIISQYPDMLHSIDNPGWNTALHAAQVGNVHILKLLKDNSVNLTHTNNHKWNILHVACQSGMFEMCQYIISQYPDMLHSIDNNGWNTALHAARGGNIQILKLLKDNSVNMTHTDKVNKNILHVACVNGRFEMCQYIISQYPDMLHSIDNDGCNTALHAARGENVHILKLLKDNSVNLTHTNNHKCNILHVACQSGMFEMCQFIISQYPDMLHSIDNPGWNTALHAAQVGNVHILKLLKDNSVNLTHTNNHKWNILHVACQSGMFEMCQYIISQYPDMLHSIDNNGWNTALHAARGGNIQILKLLKDNSVNMTHTDKVNKNILHVACVNGRFEMCQYIISQYPDMLHSIDNDGCNTALHAARGGNVHILKLLKDNSVNLTHTNNHKCNILHVACQSGMFEMCQFIISPYPDMLHSIDNPGWNTALHAAQVGNVHILKLLKDNSVNLTHTNKLKWNILHVACQSGMFEMCQYIISQYPDMLHSIDNDRWNTALHAAQGGNVHILKLLKDNSVNLTHTIKHRWNILHVACKYGMLETCSHIISQFSDMIYDKTVYEYNSAHITADSNENTDSAMHIIDLLAENGLDIYSITADGETVLTLACRRTKMRLCEHLIQFYPRLLDIRGSGIVSAKVAASVSGSLELVKFIDEAYKKRENTQRKVESII